MRRILIRSFVILALSTWGTIPFWTMVHTNAIEPAKSATSEQTPIGARWWPSEWGEQDQRGAANRITPKKVLEARDLIRAGETYQLGRLYESEMPIPGKRHYSLTIPGLPTGAPSGQNQLVHNDELISGEIGQLGTQFDGLGHIGVHMGSDDYFYNGFRLSEFGSTYGLKQLGVENVGPIFTRGVLLDVARVRGERLPGGAVITVDDLKEATQQAKTSIHEGDAVLIHTGHGFWWKKDNRKYGDEEPGIGMEAAKWLSRTKGGARRRRYVGCGSRSIRKSRSAV